MTLSTVRTGMAAYMGIAARIELDRIKAAREKEIADSLNPPVAATLVWDSHKKCMVYQTAYFGDVRVTYKQARRPVMIRFTY